MKKITYLLLCLMMATFTLSGCRAATAKPMATETFNEKMSELGYEVIDGKEYLADDTVEESSFAMKPEYQIEFFQFVDSSSAYDFFASQKDIYESMDGIKNMEQSVSINNKTSYSVVTNGQFILLSRIDDTLICTMAPEDKRGEIKEVLKNLNE